MPYGPNDSRYKHLELARFERNPLRRKKFASVPPPNRGSRQKFGNSLEEKIDQLTVQATTNITPQQGIQPHLVFRIPLAKGASQETIADRLQDVGITVVSYENDGAVIAFREDLDLARFKEAVEKYRRGPRINPKTNEPFDGTKWDIFEFIEADEMRRYERKDRIGIRLAEEIGKNGEILEEGRIYNLDIELWHRGPNKVQADVNSIKFVLDNTAQSDNRILDEFVGNSLCLIRVSVTGEKLSLLLDLDIVAEIEIPPVPVFDAFSASTATAQKFPEPPTPEPNGPRVCILDSGIVSNHPLLKKNTAHEQAILTNNNTPSDENGHGTRVAGIVLFGSIRACFTNGSFSSPIRLFMRFPPKTVAL